MKVGDLVKLTNPYDDGTVGVVIAIDPEDLGDIEEVLVMWGDSTGLMNHSTEYLEVVNASR